MLDVGPNSLSSWKERYSSPRFLAKSKGAKRLKLYKFATSHIKDTTLTMLDVGSGTGHGAQYLMSKHQKWRITGVDFVTSAAIIPTIGIDLRTEDIPGIYDYVLCIQTLEHFRDPGVVMTKLLQACKKELIVMVPWKEAMSNASHHESVFGKRFFKRYGKPLISHIGSRVKVIISR